MATELALSHPVVRAVRHEVDVVHDELVHERRTVARVVEGLLDGGWSGRAAQQWAEGWAQWEAGCDEVLTALAALTATVGRVADDLAAGDRHRAACLARVGRRLEAGA